MIRTNRQNQNLTLVAPFDAGTTVKNLFYPYDEHTLLPGATKLGLEGSTKQNGCLNELTMVPLDFRAYVPKSAWIQADPMITGFDPGHDARIISTVAPDKSESVEIKIYFL